MMRLFYVLFITTLLISPAHSQSLNLSDNQTNILKFAYKVAVEDGHTEPRYLLGIIMQESKAGDHKAYRVAGPKPSNRYFGIGQIKLAAAMDVMKRFPEMWKFLETNTREEVQAKLILDDEFNIRVASKYTLMMGINDHANRGITAYNTGLGGVKRIGNLAEYPYTSSVKSYARKFEKISFE